MEDLRRPFELGTRRWTRDTQSWVLLTLFALVSSAAGALVSLLWLPPRRGEPSLSEQHLPISRWSVEWSPEVEGPSVEQAVQLSTSSTVLALVALLACILSVASAFVHWKQRVTLRHKEYAVHVAVGAREGQVLARFAGEGRAWLPIIVVGSLLMALLIPRIVQMTFPGSVTTGWTAAIALLPALVIIAAVCHLEVAAGRLIRRTAVRRFDDVVSPLTFALLLGFVMLTGTGLLVRHGPHPEWGSSLATTAIHSATLSASGRSERAELLEAWQRRLAEGGHPVGIASAGTVRGTGVRDPVTVDCGACSIGGMSAPIQRVRAEFFAVAPDTFVHLDRTIQSGRDFSWADAGAPSVAIVNQSLAREYFQRGEAVGRKLRFGDSQWLTVVGVVEDRDHSPHLREYEVFLPIGQMAPDVIEAISAGPEIVLSTAPVGVQIGKALAVGDIFGVHEWIRSALRLLGFTSLLLVVLGAWASTRSESRSMVYEMGLRMAVGARNQDLVTFLAGAIGRRLALAICAGAWLSLFLGAGLHRLPGSVPQFDLVIWCGVGLTILAAALLAAVPAYRRISRVTPAQAIRTGT